MYFPRPTAELDAAQAAMEREYHPFSGWSASCRDNASESGFQKRDEYTATCALCGARLCVSVRDGRPFRAVIIEQHWLNHVLAVADARQIYGCPPRTPVGGATIGDEEVSTTYADGHTTRGRKPLPPEQRKERHQVFLSPATVAILRAAALPHEALGQTIDRLLGKG